MLTKNKHYPHSQASCAMLGNEAIVQVMDCIIRAQNQNCVAMQATENILLLTC